VIAPAPQLDGSEGGRRAVLERLQGELAQLERELLEREYMRRADGLEHVRGAVRRLGELGSPSGILDRAAQELGVGSEFDRVLISELAGAELAPRVVWERGADRAANERLLGSLRAARIALQYPLMEHDVASSRVPQLVDVGIAGPRAPAALSAVLGWRSYVVAAIVVDGKTVGLLHADRSREDREVDAVDLELIGQFAEGLGDVFDRAVLRETLERHRSELQSAVNWLSDRLGRLSASGRLAGTAANGSGVDAATIDALTPRELQVLGLMARGRTNAGIASVLLVREGTVKYHVKNILRKVGARSRADAVARYARAAPAREPR
jgi:LuxR family transcriptional regulator, regulator of acetate metabolism